MDNGWPVRNGANGAFFVFDPLTEKSLDRKIEGREEQ
jgi:hypothetical protein